MHFLRLPILAATCLAAPLAAQILPTDPDSLSFSLPVEQVQQEPDFLEGKLLDAEKFAEASAAALRPRADAIRILKRPAPFYPYKLIRSNDDPENPEFRPLREEGSAEIALLVGTDGKARLANIRKATGNSFGLTAAEAALQWEFEPLLNNGAPAEFQVVIPFSFKPVDPAPSPTAPAAEAPPGQGQGQDLDLIRLPLP